MSTGLKVLFGVGRFLATIPAIYWASRAVPLYKALNENDVPLDLPLREEIYRSQAISAVLSVLLTLWMFPVGLWVLNCDKIKRQAWLLLFCIIDCLMIGLLIWSIIWQFRYIPSSLKQCNYPREWVIGNGYKIFGVMSAYDVCFEGYKSCTPRKSCNNFMEAMISSIVVLVLDGITAVYPLVSVPIPWRVVRLFGQLRQLPELRFRRISAPAESKSKLGHNSIAGNDVEKWRSMHKPELVDILHGNNGHQIIISLAKYLHYSDLVSVARASKRTYAAIYHSHSPSLKTQDLRLKTCQDFKSECWCCGVQICGGCKHIFNLPDPASKTHLDNCSPYCSVCYYKYLCPRNIYGPLPPKQTISPTSRASCICQAAPGTTHSSLNVTNKRRALCKSCILLGKEKSLEVREAREKYEMRHLVGQQIRCSVCSRGLHKEGLRWWCCNLCRTECTSHFHPAWKEENLR